MMYRFVSQIAWPRRGITVIELLVVIGVLGLLMAVLLPAVQRSRESARRLQCVNNLKQVITAYHEYEATHQHFPVPRVDMRSWAELILPYLEQPEYVVDHTGRVISGPDRVITYQCPTDPWSYTLFSTRSSYVPNNGHGQHSQDGMFWNKAHRPLSPADVLDGLSVTAALSERLVRLPIEVERVTPTTDEHAWRHRLIRKTSQFVSDYDAFADLCENDSVPPNLPSLIMSEYNHIQTPNRHSCLNGIEGISHAAITASSLHDGGVNVAVCDGAVRLVSDHIDRHVWRALGTRAGGETIDSF